ncbi:MAG: DEAD/DEAH box helicase [Planctomycetia bacterium]|nr:DEAD/DEAH box helicase [Planctomycetia bacterium]
MFSPDHPLIVQGDGSILLDAHHAKAEEARQALAPYAEIVSAPEHVHTYRLSAISVWNALAMGRDGSDVKIDVGRFARYGLPQNVAADIDAWVSRHGKVALVPGPDPEHLRLDVTEPALAQEILRTPSASKWLTIYDDGSLVVDAMHRGDVKWALIRLGYPVEDRAGYGTAEPLSFRVRDGEGFEVRAYQHACVDAFLAAGGGGGGHGVVVLPCGAGKTLVGIVAAQRVGASTLVLATSEAAVEQWARELRERTDLPADAIGTYTARRKDVRPITIATYSVLTLRRGKEFPHLALFRARPFGLIVYDEVHLLPAPVFRMTASLQSVRRLGLTATLLREDGKEEDVFALIGPKRYDVPWKTLERSGHIATATCHEVRVPLDPDARARYADAEPSHRFRIAAEAPSKDAVVRRILDEHPTRPALVLGVYLDQLKRLAEEIGAPLITGETPTATRDALYAKFRAGEVRCLVLSRVGSFAIDLPTASLAIEVSGSFGSRQEEAQRLGRVLRPKEEAARFVTIVARDTVEQDTALRRQRFLVEQGYRYEIEDLQTGPTS